MAGSVTLREVRDEDLPVLFEQQKDPQAVHMAAFIHRDPEDHSAFMAHWTKIRADDSVVLRTVLLDGDIAGNIGSFIMDGRREVCYWIGKSFWGRGVATAALAQYLEDYPERPLYAHVATDNVASIRVLDKCGFVNVEQQRAFAGARQCEIDEVIMKLD